MLKYLRISFKKLKLKAHMEYFPYNPRYSHRHRLLNIDEKGRNKPNFLHHLFRIMPNTVSLKILIQIMLK